MKKFVDKGCDINAVCNGQKNTPFNEYIHRKEGIFEKMFLTIEAFIYNGALLVVHKDSTVYNIWATILRRPMFHYTINPNWFSINYEVYSKQLDNVYDLSKACLFIKFKYDHTQVRSLSKALFCL